MAFDLQKWLSNNENLGEILFQIVGEISETDIMDSLDLIEQKLENASPKARKKVYNILVEGMQNLLHHSETLPCKSGFEVSGKYIFCFLIQSKIGFHVITGNFVNEKQRVFLTKHLAHINTLDNLGLKNLYKEILNNQEFSDKGGGGLGMIDVCRKSGNKLDFKFYDYMDSYSFFSLKINITE